MVLRENRQRSRTGCHPNGRCISFARSGLIPFTTHLMMKTAAVASAVLALGALGLSRPAQAQAATIASPFHAGQWGIEGYATGQTGGVMRFFTPRTALVFTLSTNHISTSSTDNTFGPSTNHATQLDATVGFRRHSMIAQHVAATFGAGLAVGTIQQKETFPPPSGTNSLRSHYLGAFVDLGGQYMVADHFAVGIAYRLAGEHLVSGPANQTGSEFSSAFLPIRAALYF